MAVHVPPQPSFLRSWQIQVRILGALFMREALTRYGRHNIGFLWLFVEPMIFTLGVTALWTATKSVHGSDLPIVAFALTGYSSVLLWRNMPGRCIGSLQNNLALLYHRNIKVLDIFVARLLLEFGGATISFATLGIVFIALGWLAPRKTFSRSPLAGCCLLGLEAPLPSGWGRLPMKARLSTSSGIRPLI